MSKETITVKTSGDFMLQDPTSRAEIQAYGVHTVPKTAWIENQIAFGRLQVVEAKVKADQPAVEKAKK